MKFSTAFQQYIIHNGSFKKEWDKDNNGLDSKELDFALKQFIKSKCNLDPNSEVLINPALFSNFAHSTWDKDTTRITEKDIQTNTTCTTLDTILGKNFGKAKFDQEGLDLCWNGERVPGVSTLSLKSAAYATGTQIKSLFTDAYDGVKACFYNSPTEEKTEPTTPKAESTTPTNVVENDDARKRKVQAMLGFKGDDVNGIWGPKSKAALRVWQKQWGLTQTGKLDPATLAKLKEHGHIN